MKQKIAAILAVAAIFLSAAAPSSSASGRNRDKTIRILAIGNSFSTDAVEQELYGLFEAEGYDVVIGNMYIGGCPLYKHAANVKSDAAAYSYRKIVDGVMTKTEGVSISTALKDEKWDYISVQEGGGFHGFYDRTFNGTSHSMEPDLTVLTDYVLQNRPGKKTKLAYHVPWAAQDGSESRKFSFYGSDQMTMYWMICEATAQVLKAHPEFDLLLNTMDAIQNARTSWFGDTMNRDGWHLSYSRGRYTAGCLWFEKITGKSVVGNPYHPEKLSDEEAFVCQTAAHEACLHPFSITDLSWIKQEVQGSVRHVILWTLSDELSQEEKQEVIGLARSSMERFVKEIDGLVKADVIYDKRLGTSNCDFMFDMYFKDAKALEDFSVNPNHLEVVSKLKPYITGRTCLDVEL